MLVLVRLFALICIGIGIVFAFDPKKVKGVIAYFEEGKKLYMVGVIRLAIATILLLTASQSMLTGIVAGIGILFLIGGVSIFAIGLRRSKKLCENWRQKPLTNLRLLAIVPIAIGILLLYAV